MIEMLMLITIPALLLFGRPAEGAKAKATRVAVDLFHRFVYKRQRGEWRTQTPSTGLRHPSFNHCRI